MEKRNRNYWRPLWSGLIMDSEGRHIKRMGSSLSLFLYLILKANAKTGFLTKSYKEISKETGIKAKTIRNWMGNLKSKDYIFTKKQNRGLLIYVKKWKSFKDKNPSASLVETASIRALTDRLTAQNRTDTLSKSGHSENKKVGKILYSREKMKGGGLGNIYDNKYINNDYIYHRNEFNLISLTKEELLARDLAEGLNDTKNMRFYLSIVRKYPEWLLRELLSQVKQVPNNKIKRSKGALFNYLLKNYEQRKKNHLY